MNRIRKIYHRFVFGQKMVFRRADKVITISVNTSRDLIKRFRLPPKKIKMIYMGVSENFRPVEKKKAKKLMEEKFGIRKPYVLYVGRNEPHKNLKAVLLAYYYLPEGIKEGFQLVFVGKHEERYNKPIRDLIEKYNLEKKVVFTGYVDESDLPYIYSGALVYVQSSFYEGFGLPVLEAMACGVPVVASNTSSLPEVGGDAALYSDPYNVAKLSEQIRTVLEDDKLREKLIKKGFSQIKKFTWFAAASSLLDCFNERGETIHEKQ